MSNFADECQRKHEEMTALRKDAERYRWIRTAGAWESEVGMDILSEDPAKFDQAVDLAIASLAAENAKAAEKKAT